jgi:chaperonin GroEL (HSP60 family)
MVMVTRIAMQNAASANSVLLMTEFIIAEKPEKQKISKSEDFEY